MKWEEWVERIARAREEFEVREGEGESWVEEEERGQGGGKDEVGLREFGEEKVEGRQGLRDGAFWDGVAEGESFMAFF